MISLTTPNAQDGFSRIMAEAFDEREIISVSTGMQAFFGSPASASQTLFSPDASAVDIDIIRGNKKTAALVPRGTVSRSIGSTQKNLQGGKFSSFARKFPLCEEEGDISADDLIARVAGESASQALTRVQRMRILALRIHQESIRRITRLFERLASQSMLEAKMDAILDTARTDMQYDFLRKSTHRFATANEWNDTDADIIGDLTTMCDLVRQDGNITPDFLGLGKNVANAVVNDTIMQTLANIRGFSFVALGEKNQPEAKYQRYIDSGWNPLGKIVLPAGYSLWVFTYLDEYENDSGTLVPYMPVDQAFVTSTMARRDRYFGPGEVLPIMSGRRDLYQEVFGVDIDSPVMPPMIQNRGAVIRPEMFYCDAYPAPGFKSATIRSQAAPIFAQTQTDAVVVITDLLV